MSLRQGTVDQGSGPDQGTQVLFKTVGRISILKPPVRPPPNVTLNSGSPELEDGQGVGVVNKKSFKRFAQRQYGVNAMMRRPVSQARPDSGAGGDSARSGGSDKLSEKEQLRKTYYSRSKKKKVKLRRAPGFEDLEKHRLGPIIIIKNFECTPVSLWRHPDPHLDYPSLMEKHSTDLIPVSPRASELEIMRPSIATSMQSFVPYERAKSPALSWNAHLTELEEEEFLAEANFLEPFKLAYSVPLESEIIQKHDTETVRVYQPNGDFILQERTRVVLKETETTFLIRTHGKYFHANNEDAPDLIGKNAHYKTIVQLHTDVPGAFSDRATQTFRERERDKSTQLVGVGVVDQEQVCNKYMMLDDMEKDAEDEAKRLKLEEETNRRALENFGKQEEEVPQEVKDSDSSGDSSDDEQVVQSTIDWKLFEEADAAEEEEIQLPGEVSDSELALESDEEFDVEVPLEEIYEKREKKIAEAKPSFLPDIRSSLMTLERMASTNRFQYKHMEIRGMDNLFKKKKKVHANRQMFTATGRANEVLDSGPKLARFWTFRSATTKGKEVTKIDVHATNGNLIAASYGWTDYASPPNGLVCIWNSKNIGHPERVYNFEVAATVVAFSKLTPYLLAIGLLDGNIFVYDIRYQMPNIVCSTAFSQKKHFGPVWELIWMEEKKVSTSGAKVHESLISLGDDGHLYKWNPSEGFEANLMLRVRRSALKIPGRREKRAEALISQYSASFAVCFYPDDPSQYLIGTEEGFIHKGTTAFTEHYVSTYLGHTGPVYCIQFSPFAKDIFISCGGDWSVKIWKEDLQTGPLLTCVTGLTTVFDVKFSPNMSAAFVCTSENNIEVWDITINTLEPVIQYQQSNNGCRCVCFYDYLQGLLIGDDNGGMTLYSLQNFPVQPFTPSEKADMFLAALIPGYRKQDKKETQVLHVSTAQEVLSEIDLGIAKKDMLVIKKVPGGGMALEGSLKGMMASTTAIGSDGPGQSTSKDSTAVGASGETRPSMVSGGQVRPSMVPGEGAARGSMVPGDGGVKASIVPRENQVKGSMVPGDPTGREMSIAPGEGKVKDSIVPGGAGGESGPKASLVPGQETAKAFIAQGEAKKASLVPGGGENKKASLTPGGETQAKPPSDSADKETPAVGPPETKPKTSLVPGSSQAETAPRASLKPAEAATDPPAAPPST